MNERIIVTGRVSWPDRSSSQLSQVVLDAPSASHSSLICAGFCLAKYDLPPVSERIFC